MANAKRSGGLHVIFSFFLGLMVTAFVGIGVFTFYPPPDADARDQIESLSRQEQATRNARPADALTEEDRLELQQFEDQQNELRDEIDAVIEPWMRMTSIILIAFATLVMIISLVRADELPVISNGLLLGGVFTMVYGVGWIVAADSSVSRFVVMTIALAITIALGYVRFVRGQRMASGSVATSPGDAAGLSEIEARLRDVEDRLDIAANALGQRSDPS